MFTYWIFLCFLPHIALVIVCKFHIGFQFVVRTICNKKKNHINKVLETFPTESILSWYYHPVAANSTIIVCANCCPSFLFLADRSGVLCCCTPTASRFNILRIQRCSSSYFIVMSVLLSYCCLPNNTLAIPLWSLTSTWHFPPSNLQLTAYFLFASPFSLNPKSDVGKS